MKKIISVLLCLALLIAFPSVMSAQETEESAKMQEIITVLAKLGVVDKTVFDSDKSALVTRAEFVNYAAAMIKLSEIKDKRYFNDVSADHWAFGYINSMVEVGAISLAPDGHFNPDNKVTYEQACKILMCLAGYKQYASYSLTEYVQLAHTMGVGISYDSKAELSFGAALEMLYNTLTVTVAKNDMTKDDENILKLYHSGYVAVGTVDSIYGMETNNEVLEENMAFISGEQFFISEDVVLEDYFGEVVKFIYIEDKQDDTKEIIFAKPRYNDRTVTIESGLITGFNESTGSIQYFKDSQSGTTKSTTISRNSVFVYNGKLMQGSLKSKIDEFINGTRKGSIKIVKRTGSDVDCVVIKSYETYIAKAYDVEDSILYNAYDKDKDINLEEFDVVRIKSRYENNASLPSTFPDALSVAISEDNKILEIYLSDEQQKTVNSLGNETITLDDEEYALDKVVLDKFMTVFELGNSVKVKVDIFGEIVYAERLVTSTDFQLGYITKIRVVEKDDGNVITMRVFRKDKQFTYFDIVDKVIIDGEKYKAQDIANIVSAFPGVNSYNGEYEIFVEPQMVRFKVNDENIVKEIDTYNVGEKEDKNHTLTRTSNGEVALRYWGADKRYGELDVVDSNTLVMTVPFIDSDGLATLGGNHVEPRDEMYSVGASVFTDYTYYVEAYYYTNRFIADAILVKSREDKSPHTLCMYDSINTIWNESTKEVESQLVCYSSNGKVTYKLTEAAKVLAEALNQGDIIKISTLYSDESTATSFKKIFDMQTKEYVDSTSSTDYLYIGTNLRSTYNVAKMYAYDTRGTILRGSYKLYDAADDIANIAVNASNTKLVVFDNELVKDKIYQGTIDDVRTYKMYGENCDMVLYNTAGITSPVMFVIRR